MNVKRKFEGVSIPTRENKKSKVLKDDIGKDGANKTGEKTNDASTSKADFFKGLSFYVLQAGIEKARMNVFKHQIVQNGGHIEEVFSDDGGISHIIVNDGMEIDRMLRLLGSLKFPKAPVVKTVWLSSCLKNKAVVDIDDFLLKPKPKISQTESTDLEEQQSQSKKGLISNVHEPHSDAFKTGDKELPNFRKHAESDHKTTEDSDYVASDDEDEAGGRLDSTFDLDLKMKTPVDKWICAQSSKNPMTNCNRHITEKLEEMVKAYDSTNDKWRSFGYKKCIRALTRHPKTISSWEEAKALPGVGERLADKIWEIAQSGELRKLNTFKSSEEMRIMSLFNNVWGAGPHTAQIWFQQGFRSIEDLKTKAKLTSQQMVGVRLYDDLLERMPREEAGKIADTVKDAAESIQFGIIAQACGSYRRGKVTCGDVDILVTHPDGKSHNGVFGKLLDKLHQSGFLTDDLVTSEENGNQKKYLGVCKLPGDDTKHRRLDIIVVPYHEYACGLLYFTGSAHFNRSLRLMCKRLDMSLSEHALRYGVIRHGGERVHEGTIIPTPTEESVFKVLKIPYRPPEERDH